MADWMGAWSRGGTCAMGADSAGQLMLTCPTQHMCHAVWVICWESNLP